MPGPAACCSLLLALASTSLPAQVTWTQIPTTTAPTARVGHAMAHDLPRDKVVLFGGQDASGRLSDTWLFDGSAGWRRTRLPRHRRVPRTRWPMILAAIAS